MSSSSSDDFQPPEYIRNAPIISNNKSNNMDSLYLDYFGGMKNSSGNYADSQQYKSNPFDSSESLNIYAKHTVTPLFSTKNKYYKDRFRHSYPNNAFIRKAKELKSFIMSETERLANQDTRFCLGANLLQEVECLGSSPNCSIRRRMMKMGLL
ncbi:hypothetical protein M9Y10_001023 [Tritrichomonas musculus]|uniref:Uncharacterized protein n=1 Tax=Tritrichomonas musculus TaxID=1915356 RepID=A0ABR2L6T5_9EUKA